MTPDRAPMSWPAVIAILLLMSVAAGLLNGWLTRALSLSSWLTTPVMAATLAVVAVLLVGRLRGGWPRR